MSVVKVNIEGVSNQVEFRLIDGFPGYAVGDDGTVITSKVHGTNPLKKSNPWKVLKQQVAAIDFPFQIRIDGNSIALVCSSAR